ncbi:MAG: hypothetical protein HY706_22240, partial [Candidatus Hydrogenedentes bacterium]|nr:hypothetical protein [Candidatus Hydrogenedentota bacterium]
MIEFDCTHCNNHLKVEDRHVGRQARCRVCGGMLVVPNVDADGRLQFLTDAARIARYERLVRRGEIQCRKYEQDLATLYKKYQDARRESERAAALESDLKVAEARLADAEAAFKARPPEGPGTLNVSPEPDLAPLSDVVAALTAQLEAERTARQQLQQTFESTPAATQEIEALHHELQRN